MDLYADGNQLTGDLSGWTGPLSGHGTLTTLQLVDGAGGNDCLTAGGDAGLEAWLDGLEPGWDACDP